MIFTELRKNPLTALYHRCGAGYGAASRGQSCQMYFQYWPEPQTKIHASARKINEQAFTTGVMNFSAHQVDKIPYSPSGKVRYGEVIRMLDAA